MVFSLLGKRLLVEDGGVISDDRDKFYAVLKALKEAKVIDINYNNYGKITVLKDKLDVNDYKTIISE